MKLRATQAFSLQDVLRNRRVTLGIPQHELAAQIGTVQSAISEWENDIVQPTLPFFIKWANALGFVVTLENLK